MVRAICYIRAANVAIVRKSYGCGADGPTRAGWCWLGEAFGAVRTIGALLICIGIVVIATAG
jgi:multidrug transporter EmrE-like cation transporter